MPVLRFYAELNDFLPPALRGRDVACVAAPHESLKHVIEALGVPHTEVALALVDGRPASLQEGVAGARRISVYPAFRWLGPLDGEGAEDADTQDAGHHATPAARAGGDTVGAAEPAAARAAAEPRFIADVHLARLARLLRFAGYDTLWRATWNDAELVAQARAEGRVVLTRDRDLLMRRDVERGCHLRDATPPAQLGELARRLGLDLRGARAGRCLRCNAVLQPVDKAAVEAALPPATRRDFERFWRCPCCAGVFWCGSHWKRMQAVLEAAAPPSPERRAAQAACSAG